MYTLSLIHIWDKKILEKLAGHSYDDFEKIIRNELFSNESLFLEALDKDEIDDEYRRQLLDVYKRQVTERLSGCKDTTLCWNIDGKIC